MTTLTLAKENGALLSFSHTREPFESFGVDSTTRTNQEMLNGLVDVVTNKLAGYSGEQFSTEIVRVEDNANHSMPPSTYGDDLLKNIKELLAFLESEKSSIEHRYMSKQFLTEALEELTELDDYAKEEEFDPPSPIAKALAQELLEKLTRKLPRYYAVSLWEDGDVIIYSGSKKWRVSVYCRANGGASFYVDSPNKHDYEGHYESASDMPITLIFDALKKFST